MGTSGTGIFQDDVALDVREHFLGHLLDTSDAAEATRRTMEDHSDPDVDEAPAVWLGLAATSWEYGFLDPQVKARALAVIDDPAELERWPADRRNNRRKVLLALRAKLETPPPPPKKPRRKKRIGPPHHEAAGPDGVVVASAFEIANSVARIGQVMLDFGDGGGGVFAAECGHDEIGLRWLSADVLEISYPKRVTPQRRDDQKFHAGRVVRIVYRTV